MKNMKNLLLIFLFGAPLLATANCALAEESHCESKVVCKVTEDGHWILGKQESYQADGLDVCAIDEITDYGSDRASCEKAAVK
jgi:hypothetical protein